MSKFSSKLSTVKSHLANKQKIIIMKKTILKKLLMTLFQVNL